MSKIVRCPYCVLGSEFRPMIRHLDGRYICDKCGHTACPKNPAYGCQCETCLKYRISFAG